jgi:hypothetical protein
VGLLEVAIFSIDGDVAAEEKKHAQLEFGAEVNGEPHSVRLRRVDDVEAKAWDVRSQQRADSEGNFARHGSANYHWLKRCGVDIRIALPGKIVLVFGAEVDVEDAAAVDVLLPDEVEEVVRLDL